MSRAVTGSRIYLNGDDFYLYNIFFPNFYSVDSVLHLISLFACSSKLIDMYVSLQERRCLEFEKSRVSIYEKNGVIVYKLNFYRKFCDRRK